MTKIRIPETVVEIGSLPLGMDVYYLQVGRWTIACEVVEPEYRVGQRDGWLRVEDSSGQAVGTFNPQRIKGAEGRARALCDAMNGISLNEDGRSEQNLVTGYRLTLERPKRQAPSTVADLERLLKDRNLDLNEGKTAVSMGWRCVNVEAV